ncbi:MAG: hypothetical protein HC802_10530, partial [Caldilineaceae bacterium]|nr:hypothetical protein [Caldilineaceae bacterium]
MRTVHGLGLDDLECIHRYRQEIDFLTAEERMSIMLDADVDGGLYQARNGQSARPNSSQPDARAEGHIKSGVDSDRVY